MKLYSNKQKWKIVLLFIALILVGVSLFYSNEIVSKVAQRERERVTQWADAIKKRAELVRLTNRSFNQLRDKELAEMELWIAATKEISKSTPLDTYQSYDLPLQIINQNNKIPVIVLDQDKNVSTYINLDFTLEDLSKRYPNSDTTELEKIFEDSLVTLANNWDTINPSFTIEIYDDLFMTYYYNDSKDIYRLEKERDSLISAFNNELIENTDLVPVLITDSTKRTIVASNLEEEKLVGEQLVKTIDRLKAENTPIPIQFTEDQRSYVFYANSPEIKMLQYFPFVQFLVIGLFILIAYVIFSTFRKAEQNQVWAGMAKETAHQLGTPISSLMAWIEILKEEQVDKNIPLEMDKDIKRLAQITDRFSKIGAASALKDENITNTVDSILSYLKSRVSEKIIITSDFPEEELIVPHSPPLIEWVIENICKNAIDAMENKGELKISISKKQHQAEICISDTGKGMSLKQQKSIFKPGFTTKKRGWGLGLTLAQRIIKEYHKGKISVESTIGKGTVFTVTLPLTSV